MDCGILLTLIPASDQWNYNVIFASESCFDIMTCLLCCIISWKFFRIWSSFSWLNSHCLTVHWWVINYFFTLFVYLSGFLCFVGRQSLISRTETWSSGICLFAKKKLLTSNFVSQMWPIYPKTSRVHVSMVSPHLNKPLTTCGFLQWWWSWSRTLRQSNQLR